MKDILALLIAIESVFFLNECAMATSNFDFYMLGSISIVLIYYLPRSKNA